MQLRIIHKILTKAKIINAKKVLCQKVILGNSTFSKSSVLNFMNNRFYIATQQQAEV